MKVFIVLEYNEQSGFKPFWFVKQFQHLWGRVGSTKAGPTGPPKTFPPRRCFHQRTRVQPYTFSFKLWLRRVLWLPSGCSGDACCSGYGARSHTAQGWPTRHFLEPRLGADFFHLQIIMIRLIYCRPNTFLGLSGPHSSKHGRTKSLDRLWKSCKKMSCNWGCMLKA